MRITPAILLLLVPFLLSADPPGLPPTIASGAVITIAESRQIVDTLASDAMMGRPTGTPWIDAAATIIASEFALAGLEPLYSSFFQEYELRRENLSMEGTRLAVADGKVPLKDGFVPYEFTGAGSVKASIAFVGYGVSLPDSGYDDYAAVDVRGRIVLAVAGQPSRLGTGRATYRAPWFSTAREKARQAALHGAAGFLMVGHPRQSRILRPFGYPWPGVYPGVPPEAARLRLALPDTSTPPIPAASISGDVARRILKISIDRLARILDEIDSTSTPRSEQLDSRAVFEVALDRSIVNAKNVVGIVRGRTRPDEFVVVGAHYDHLGTASAPMAGAGEIRTDTIFNGADDNASGTAALILAARSLASLPVDQRPDRSIVFVAFSGEELGLYGSRAFMATGGIEPAAMQAMLNMDMVGRNGHDSLSVGGINRSPELSAAILEANRGIDSFTISQDVEQYFFRSDQAPFAMAGVPVAFFHAGEHADYHRVTDEADRIDHGKLVRVARLASRSAWLLASLPLRPSFLRPDPRTPAAQILDF